MKKIAFLPHRHVNMYFATPEEHCQRLADGAIRCMEQLLIHTAGREPATGFRHMLAALLEGMTDLRKEMEP